MALFKLTVKNSKNVGGIKIEKGMSVEVVSDSNPMRNGHHSDVQDAFARKYNIDIKKAGGISESSLEIVKIS